MGSKIYTAQEMRIRATIEGNVWGDRTTVAMLRQAADLMEREEMREKKYEYGEKYYSGIISPWHEEEQIPVESVLKGSVVVRRPVGEWEEVCK